MAAVPARRSRVWDFGMMCVFMWADVYFLFGLIVNRVKIGLNTYSSGDGPAHVPRILSRHGPTGLGPDGQL